MLNLDAVDSDWFEFKRPHLELNLFLLQEVAHHLGFYPKYNHHVVCMFIQGSIIIIVALTGLKKKVVP